jgi:hypothetical protein
VLLREEEEEKKKKNLTREMISVKIIEVASDNQNKSILFFNLN